MAVKFAQALKQAQPEQQPVVKQEVNPAIELASQLVVLHRELQKVDAFNLMKAYDEIKKNLAAEVAKGTHKADAPVEIHTPEGVVVFKAATKKTVITDKAAMIEALGDELFAKLATVGVTDLKKYLGEGSISGFTEEVYAHRVIGSVVPNPQ